MSLIQKSLPFSALLHYSVLFISLVLESLVSPLVSCQSIHFHQFNEYIYPSGFILLRVILLFPVGLISRNIPLAFKLNRSEKEKSIFFLTFNLDLLPSFPLNNIFMALVP